MKSFLAILVVILCCSGNTYAWYGPKTKHCRVHDYTCVSKHAFCEAGYVIHCAKGTHCSTPHRHVTRSPCIGTIWNEECPHGDYSCSSPHTFCMGGQYFKCPAGTVCKWGKKEGSPCVNSPHGHCGPNLHCTSDHTYCNGGKEMHCAAGTYCHDKAPCK